MNMVYRSKLRLSRRSTASRWRSLPQPLRTLRSTELVRCLAPVCSVSSTALAKVPYAPISTYRGMPWSPACRTRSCNCGPMAGAARMRRTAASGIRSEQLDSPGATVASNARQVRGIRGAPGDVRLRPGSGPSRSRPAARRGPPVSAACGRCTPLPGAVGILRMTASINSRRSRSGHERLLPLSPPREAAPPAARSVTLSECTRWIPMAPMDRATDPL